MGKGQGALGASVVLGAGRTGGLALAAARERPDAVFLTAGLPAAAFGAALGDGTASLGCAAAGFLAGAGLAAGWATVFSVAAFAAFVAVFFTAAFSALTGVALFFTAAFSALAGVAVFAVVFFAAVLFVAALFAAAVFLAGGRASLSAWEAGFLDAVLAVAMRFLLNLA